MTSFGCIRVQEDIFWGAWSRKVLIEISTSHSDSTSFHTIGLFCTVLEQYTSLTDGQTDTVLVAIGNTPHSKATDRRQRRKKKISWNQLNSSKTVRDKTICVNEDLIGTHGRTIEQAYA